MSKVTGIGGIFFKCENPEDMKKWYKNHLGIESDQYGGCFEWIKKDGKKGHTVWSLFTKNTKYFEPSQQQFMINYRVKDLKNLLKELNNQGVVQIGDIEESEFGKFGWILDPEGNKIELWQAPENFEDYTEIKQIME